MEKILRIDKIPRYYVLRRIPQTPSRATTSQLENQTLGRISELLEDTALKVHLKKVLVT